MEDHVVSKKRVADHGEVYTRLREVNAMLDLVKPETERVESRFLEPACGSGNFLIEILRRKLVEVERRYRRSQSEFERYAFLSASSLYGIDILADNVETCRNRLIYLLDEHYSSLYQKKTKETFRQAIRFVLGKNIVHGDALSLKTVGTNPQPIAFSEWSFVRGNQIKRRDFIFEELIPDDEQRMPLFARQTHQSDNGNSAFIPAPVRDYPLCHYLRIADAE